MAPSANLAIELMRAIWPICHQPYALRIMPRKVVPWNTVGTVGSAAVASASKDFCAALRSGVKA
jgi:hypothetical protein